jgi:hypothetical protein
VVKLEVLFVLSVLVEAVRQLNLGVKLNEEIMRKLVLTILIIIAQSILSFSNDNNNLYRTEPFI